MADAYKKFPSFQNILFSVNQLFEIVGLQSFIKLFHLAFSYLLSLISGVTRHGTTTKNHLEPGLCTAIFDDENLQSKVSAFAVEF